MRVLKAFHGDCVFRPISSLSFWERARVRAASSLLTPGIVRTAKRRDHLTSIIRSQIKRIATCRAIHEVLGFGT